MDEEERGLLLLLLLPLLLLCFAGVVITVEEVHGGLGPGDRVPHQVAVEAPVAGRLVGWSVGRLFVCNGRRAVR